MKSSLLRGSLFDPAPVSALPRQAPNDPHLLLRQSRKLAELAMLRRRTQVLEEELKDQIADSEIRPTHASKPFRMIPVEEAPAFWPRELGPMPDFFETCQSRKEVEDWLYFFDLWNP